MNLLKSVETTIANLVEGTFGRIFRSEVRPMELARKLAREMDTHRTFSVSRVYVPNEYSVWLSPQDRKRYDGIEQEVIDELCAYLLEHARREDLIMSSQPHVVFHTDERLALGEFGIQARLVRATELDDRRDAPSVRPDAPSVRGDAPSDAPSDRRDAPPVRPDAPPVRAGEPSARPEEPPVRAGEPSVRPEEPSARPDAPSVRPDEHGQTMIYSSAARTSEPLEAVHARRQPRALLAISGRRLLVPPEGGVLGRSRDCAIVLDDPGISRRHARIQPDGAGWSVEDLGSTNGVLLNGSEVHGIAPLQDGDRLELGSTEIVFELG